MKKDSLGCIKQLFITKKNVKKIITKVNVELDTKGIIDDKFYDKDTNRSVLITSTLAYDLLKKNDIFAEFGSLGENILVSFNPYDLKTKTQISIGDTILEITNECTICNHLNKIDTKAPSILKKDRGVFAKVIKGGSIKLNDSIELLN
jgi:MOSC domain-containing protein YiiM